MSPVDIESFPKFHKLFIFLINKFGSLYYNDNITLFEFFRISQIHLFNKEKSCWLRYMYILGIGFIRNRKKSQFSYKKNVVNYLFISNDESNISNGYFFFLFYYP